jgi:hypothetical protein
MTTLLLEGDPEHRKSGDKTARQLADRCFASLPEAVDTLLASSDRPA